MSPPAHAAMKRSTTMWCSAGPTSAAAVVGLSRTHRRPRLASCRHTGEPAERFLHDVLGPGAVAQRAVREADEVLVVGTPRGVEAGIGRSGCVHGAGHAVLRDDGTGDNDHVGPPDVTCGGVTLRG